MSAACRKCGYDEQAPIAATHEMFIEADPPSLNQRLHNAGAARWKYGKERNKWHVLVMAAKTRARIPNAIGKRRVTLTRNYFGQQKERDADNLSGGMKMVVDSMVLLGVLVDDAPAHVELHYAQQRAEPRGLHVLIEDFA